MGLKDYASNLALYGSNGAIFPVLYYDTGGNVFVMPFVLATLFLLASTGLNSYSVYKKFRKKQ